MLNEMQGNRKAKLLLSLSLSHVFTLKRSRLVFRNEAQVILATAYVKLIGNEFVGNGSIEIGKGRQSVERANVLANNFSGVQLRFTGNPIGKVITLRNNAFQDGAHFNASSNGFSRCDTVDGGFSAGCDI